MHSQPPQLLITVRLHEHTSIVLLIDLDDLTAARPHQVNTVRFTDANDMRSDA